MYCHDLKVMSLNPSRVKLGVPSTSVYCTLTENNKFSSNASLFALIQIQCKTINSKYLCVNAHFSNFKIFFSKVGECKKNITDSHLVVQYEEK